MKQLNKLKGNIGEAEACNFLKEQGYSILQKNFRCKMGEIDIIGKDGDYIVFIEVKSRCCNTFGKPCEAITDSKKRKLYNCSQFYIMKNRLNSSLFRYDVIEVMLSMALEAESINLIKNAFYL